MPEIAEVARIVNRLRTHLAGRIIAKVTPFEDAMVYRDTTPAAFRAALEGKKVLEARQWGKYFWLVMDSSPHPLLHFGMTGWIRFQNDSTAHYRATTPEDTTEWPPRFTKFLLQLPDASELAFTDPRRLSRIRLIEHPTGDLRAVSPLAENGPDPVQAPVSVEWLAERLGARRVPVKAWLLDQSAIAGVGNWVADEILYHARIHPEQVTSTLDADMVARLHRALGYVTKFAVEAEADSKKFPKDWLMLHRWGKGAKDSTLPSGDRIDFVKVGSRTSAFVPSLQKLVGEPAKKKAPRAKGGKEVDGEQEEGEGSEPEVKPAPKRRAPAKAAKKEEDGDGDAPPPPPARRSRRSAKAVKAEEEEGGSESPEVPAKRAKRAK